MINISPFFPARVSSVEGGDLLTHVEKKGKLTEDEAKFIYHQLFAAVRYLHDRGIVHRDLKPENVLLANEDGVKRLKIADFGFARIIEKNTLVSSVVGTPSYMGKSSSESPLPSRPCSPLPDMLAPEVLRKNGKGYKESADMWSIGVMLYAWYIPAVLSHLVFGCADFSSFLPPALVWEACFPLRRMSQSKPKFGMAVSVSRTSFSEMSRMKPLTCAASCSRSNRMPGSRLMRPSTMFGCPLQHH